MEQRYAYINETDVIRVLRLFEVWEFVAPNVGLQIWKCYFNNNDRLNTFRR